MLKYSIAAAAIIAASSLAVADPMADRGDKPSSNSAADHAPGQMKEGGSAKDFAPGQTKSDGSKAKQVSPGHLKNDAASRSDEKNSLERKSENSENLKPDRAKNTDRDGKAGSSEKNVDNDRLDNDGKTKAQSQNETSKSSVGAGEGTEGRAGGKGSLTGVTEEKRTRAKSVFSQHHVEPAHNLNVSVNIGVALPRTVHLYPVPEDIIVIVPEYRGYNYIMLDDNRVAIVDPDTFEIVDIIVVA